MTLSCTVDDLPQGCLICIRGRADTDAAVEIDRAFLQVTAVRPKLVVLDLSEMNFIASLIIGSLINLNKAVTRRGGRLRLAALQPLVADSFDRLRLQQVIEVWDTVASALAADSAGSTD